MRKFYFQNSRGERKDLNNPNGVIVRNPSGLGFNMTINTANVDDGFFKLTHRQNNTHTIAMDLLFMRGYEDYRSLVNWINSSEDLYIVYVPFGSEEFMCRVSVSYMTKTDLKAGGVLIVPVSLTALSPWFSPVALHLTMQEQSSNAMRYTYRYDSSLIYGANIAGRYAVEISPAGHIPASVKIRHTGQMTNPKITLVGLSTGKVHGTCEVEAQIGSGESFEFSTEQSDSYIRVIGSDGSMTDLMDRIDPSGDPFFRVPLLEQCVLSIMSESDISGVVDVSISYYYRSV